MDRPATQAEIVRALQLLHSKIQSLKLSQSRIEREALQLEATIKGQLGAQQQ
jgi:hypothetical protein